MKKLAFAIALAVASTAFAQGKPVIRCVWPDGSQTLPNAYTNTCPQGSTPRVVRYD